MCTANRKSPTLTRRSDQIPRLRDICRLARSLFYDRLAPAAPPHFLTPPIGYSDEKIARLTREAVQAGFNHFKMKVGADRADDLRRGKLIRSIIDDPQYLPDGHAPRDPRSPALAGKNAGPTGAVLMIDANQVWDVQEAIEYVASLEEIKPWCVHTHVYFFSSIAA